MAVHTSLEASKSYRCKGEHGRTGKLPRICQRSILLVRGDVPAGLRLHANLGLVVSGSVYAASWRPRATCASTATSKGCRRSYPPPEAFALLADFRRAPQRRAHPLRGTAVQVDLNTCRQAGQVRGSPSPGRLMAKWRNTEADHNLLIVCLRRRRPPAPAAPRRGMPSNSTATFPLHNCPRYGEP